MKKRILSLLLAVVLTVIIIPSCIGKASALENMAPLGEGINEVSSDELLLSIDTETAALTVKNLKTGDVWLSNPISPELDPIAAGEYKTNLRSQLYVTYTNNMRQQKTVNSYVGCVNKAGCKFLKLENGFRVEYTFKDADFTVPVEYTVSGNIFSAQVVLSDIEENGENSINSISLLPYFGAGDPDDTGEILVPDGSGAVIDMNSGKVSCADYTKRYYGDDLSIPSSVEALSSQKLLLPVFGVVKNGNAFLARISSGAELAALSVCIGGKDTSYNAVYTTVDYRCVDRQSALENDANSSYAYLAQEAVSLDRYTVEYIFSDKTNADYSELVKLYRNRLETALSYTDKSDISQNFISVDLYGGVKKKTSFLGFVYTGKLAVTKYDEMKNILADLNENIEQDISAQPIEYSKSDFSGTAVGGLVPMHFLGGKKDYKNLISYCNKNGISLYPSADISTMAKGSLGFSVFRNVVSGMNQQSVRVSSGAKTLKVNNNSAKKYLLNADSILKAAKKTAQTAEKYGISGVLISGEGSRLYSDFGKKTAYRSDMKAQYEKAFEKLSENASLAFEAAYEYMLPFAETVVNVPVGSSKDMLFDRDVPFYQMVLMGKTRFSANSYNLTNPGRDYFLACIESGTALKFTLGYDETELLGVADSQSHNIGYSDLKDTVFSLSNEAESLFSKTSGAVLVDFVRLDGGVSKGTYNNGITVYTNRSNSDFIADGIEIAALDYVIVEGKTE